LIFREAIRGVLKNILSLLRKEKTLIMKMKNICLVLFALLMSVTVKAEELELPRKVENVTIKDLYGNPASLPHFGEKNLLIFYVDPDAYLAANKNNKFAEELEENCRAAGPEIYGFGILNFPDTWLPKEFLRKICRKRVEKNGATIIEDPDHTFKNAWGLGDCNKKFMLLIVTKEGNLEYVLKEEVDKQGKEYFYSIIDKYRF
jgi:hypothetical protein